MFSSRPSLRVPRWKGARRQAFPASAHNMARLRKASAWINFLIVPGREKTLVLLARRGFNLHSGPIAPSNISQLAYQESNHCARTHEPPRRTRLVLSFRPFRKVRGGKCKGRQDSFAAPLQAAAVLFQAHKYRFNPLAQYVTGSTLVIQSKFPDCCAERRKRHAPSTRSNPYPAVHLASQIADWRGARRTARAGSVGMEASFDEQAGPSARARSLQRERVCLPGSARFRRQMLTPFAPNSRAHLVLFIPAYARGARPRPFWNTRRRSGRFQNA